MTNKVSQRVHISRTDTGNFNTVCEKMGLIAPGMYEEVNVQFVSRAYEMYVTIYDPNHLQNPETTCTSTNIKPLNNFIICMCMFFFSNFLA